MRTVISRIDINENLLHDEILRLHPDWVVKVESTATEIIVEADGDIKPIIDSVRGKHPKRRYSVLEALAVKAAGGVVPQWANDLIQKESERIKNTPWPPLPLGIREE